MAKAVIERDEVVALLFAVYDMSETLRSIEALLRRDENGEEETD